MTTKLDTCTFCLQARELREPEFSQHIASRWHQGVLREWEKLHGQTHHDGHKALGIDCRCEVAA